MTKRILVATRNEGKVAELADMLRDLAVTCLSVQDAGIEVDVEETGKTFEENAILKARQYAAVSGLLTLADDSGLEVDALNGAPGVHTARFGGESLTPKQRYEKLLRSVQSIPLNQRTARFRCVVALATPDGLVGTAKGLCEGLIALRPAGTGGFGYDPVFLLPERGLTMAQLSPAEKRAVSHRGRAFRAITPLLKSVLEAS